MKVLVTGGAGYIGSHAVRELDRGGHEVVVLDNMSRGHRGAVRGYTLHEVDLLDREAVRGVFEEEKPDAVMHFAALSLVGESVKKPAKYWRANILGGLNLLDSMNETGAKLFVFSSTAAVYGIPETEIISEDHPTRPINPYGASKLAFERVLADYRAAYGLGYVVLRYFNAAGADAAGDIGEDHEPESHLIPIVLSVALGERESVTIFGDDYPTPDGTCIRDFIHVSDLASAHVLALEKMRPGSAHTYNLGNGSGQSVREVIEAARRVTGKEIPAVVGARRPGDPPRLVASSKACMEALGWRPQKAQLETIIETAWKWHSTHPDGFGD